MAVLSSCPAVLNIQNRLHANHKKKCKACHSAYCTQNYPVAFIIRFRHSLLPCVLQNLQSLPHVEIKSKILACVPCGTGSPVSRITSSPTPARSRGHQPTKAGPPRPAFARALIPFGDSDVRPSRPVALVPVNRCRLVGASQHDACPPPVEIARAPGSGKASRFWAAAPFTPSLSNQGRGRWWSGGAARDFARATAGETGRVRRHSRRRQEQHSPIPFLPARSRRCSTR